MSKMLKAFSKFQPSKGLRRWRRKNKVEDVTVAMARLAVTKGDDVPPPPSPSHAALPSTSAQPEDNPQLQEEKHGSWDALGEQVMRAGGTESQAAAPESPRGCGRAVLGTLQRVARATLRGMAGLMRRRGQQPEPQGDLGEDRHVVVEARATAAAGPRSQAAAPPSPLASQMEDVSGQTAGAAAEPLVPVAKEGMCCEDGSPWDIGSLQEQENSLPPLPPVEDNDGQEQLPEKKKKGRVHVIFVKPLHSAVLPDATSGWQEGPSSPSSVGREEADEADAALHSPCPAPAGAMASLPAAEQILADAEEGAFAKLQQDWNGHSPQELCWGAESRGQSCSSGAEGLPMAGTCEAGVEQWELHGHTRGAGAPVRSTSHPSMRPKAPSPGLCALSHSASELEGLSVDWEGTTSSGETWFSVALDSSWDSQGQESSEEERSDTTLSGDNAEEIEIYQIWVKPSLKAVLQEPETESTEGSKCPCTICREASEGADGELHSTCPGLKECLEAQAAAAGLATDSEEEEQHTPLGTSHPGKDCRRYPASWPPARASLSCGTWAWMQR